MKMSSFRYVFPQAFKSLKLNGWMTFAAIFTIAISLFLCIIFYMIILNLDYNADVIESNVEIVGYISADFPQEEYAALESALSQLPGSASVAFISKDDGLSSLSSRFPEDDLLDIMGNVNPLPDSYSVKALTPEDVAPLAAAMEELTGIESVRYGQGTVDKLFSFTDAIRKAGVGIMILLAIAAILLVAMNIRITVYARRKEIMVMKWVGATNWFIRWPFLLEGIILGLIGSIIAVSLALVVYANSVGYAAELLSFVYFVNLNGIWLSIGLYALLAGILMGALGSVISMTRFLQV